MRVLVLGANGQLGRLVVQQAPAHAKVSAYASTVCDITDLQNLQNVLSKTGPDLVINCAAYTKVDLAESEPDQAWAVNAQGVQNLVQATGGDTRSGTGRDTHLLHISTDFVFSGVFPDKVTMPYVTSAPPTPLGVYGASKAAGERILLEQAADRSTIVRTAWLYAAQGRNFLNTMLHLMQTRDELRVVHDQYGTPTAAHSLAQALWALADKPSVLGVQHWTDAGTATWYEFACEIQQQALARGLLQKAIPIKAITTMEYPTAAKRPAYSVLDRSTTEQALGLQAKPWQFTLGEVLDQIKQQEHS